MQNGCAKFMISNVFSFAFFLSAKLAVIDVSMTTSTTKVIARVIDKRVVYVYGHIVSTLK